MTRRSRWDKLQLLPIRGITRSVIWVAALTVLVACIGSSHGEEVPLQERFDVVGIEAMVQAVVGEAAQLYDSDGEEAFEDITGSAPGQTGYSAFVLNFTTGEIVAYAGHLQMVGSVLDGIFVADRPYDEIVRDLRSSEGVWITSPLTNTETHTTQMARVWMTLSDGYVFGAGYFLPDLQAQVKTAEALQLYLTHGNDAFTMITPDTHVYNDALYPLVLNATTVEVMAHGAYPQLPGTIHHAFLTLTDRPYGEIMADLERDGAAWTSYISTNPATGTQQLKRTWLYLHDGLIFAAGYYLPDSRTRSLVDQTVSAYDHGSSAAFARINSLADGRESVFITATNWDQRIVADSKDPNRVGDFWFDHFEANRSPPDIIDEVLFHGGAWVNNIETNPTTDTEQIRRSWVQLHGVIVYTAGYYIADLEAQSAVDLALLIYENDPETALDRITLPDGRGQDNTGKGAYTDTAYPFVINSTTLRIVAHGAFPEFVDECCSEASRETGDLQLEDTIKEIREDGAAWVTYEFTNPDTGIAQEKRTWLFWHDGLVFGSGYHIRDSQVQAIVAHLTFAYTDSGDINRLKIAVSGSHAYHFIIDPETMEVVAHGGGPELAADDSLSLTAADRATGEILADLESSPGAWSEYTTVNPETGQQEKKRSYLAMYGGYVFGAGYYE